MSRWSCAAAGLLLFLTPPAIAAQSADVVVSAAAGASSLPIARFSAGRWIGAPAACSGAIPSALESPVTMSASAGVTIVVPRRVQEGTAAWALIHPVIVRLFQEREREHRVTGSAQPVVAMTIDSLHEARQGAATVYYFEASKRIPDNPVAASSDSDDVDPRGLLRIGVSGWLRAAGATVISLGTASELHWDQLDENGQPPRSRPDRVPLGALTHAGQTIWITQRAAGGTPSFALFEIRERGVRAAVTCQSGRASIRPPL